MKSAKLKPTVSLVAGVLGAVFSVQASAFLVDNSKEIWIGKGDASNMKPIKVSTISEPARNYKTDGFSQTITTTVTPSQQPNNYTQYNQDYNLYNQTYTQAGQYNSPQGYSSPQSYQPQSQPSYQSYQPNYNQPSYNQPAYNNQTTNSYTGNSYNNNSYANNGYSNNNYSNGYNASYTNNSYNQSYYGGQSASASYPLSINTNSAAVLVYDIQSGQYFYQKNADQRRSIASITKIMTAMVLLDSGMDMRDVITIVSSDLVGAKTASSRLKVGDQLARSEFMLMMLMKSENPAAKALARSYVGGYDAFINAMNQKAKSLGMYSTSFSDSSGLDPRNVSSASDLVKMMKEVATNPRYQTIRNFSSARSYDFYINNYNLGARTYSASNTNRLVRDGNYTIGASKTGYIRESKRSVVMEAHVKGRPAIIVLLGADSTQNRDSDAENILTELAYRY